MHWGYRLVGKYLPDNRHMLLPQQDLNVYMKYMFRCSRQLLHNSQVSIQAPKQQHKIGFNMHWLRCREMIPEIYRFLGQTMNSRIRPWLKKKAFVRQYWVLFKIMIEKQQKFYVIPFRILNYKVPKHNEYSSHILVRKKYR